MVYDIAYANKPPENKHNIAVEMAIKVLRSKLELLEKSQTVGDNGDGTQIEYITRIEDEAGGGWRFLVKTWSGLAVSPSKVSVMNFVELSDFICKVTEYDESIFQYIKNIPVVPEREARKDSR